MSERIRITVVTVTFNASSVIAKTIESVLAQKRHPYEYFIIDGLSKDNTVAIAEQYSKAFKDLGVKYTVISEKDTGIYNAMNKGVRLATGDFIGFLNAGDWYEDDALLNITSFYEEEPFDLTYGGLNYINPKGSITIKHSKLDSFPISSRHWNHPSMFLRTELYKRHMFDESYPTYADFHLYLKMRKSKVKIRVIDKVITNFVADGVSTDVRLKKVLARAGEKYRAYRSNGFGLVYWFESYGWELLKSVYFRLK